MMTTFSIGTRKVVREGVCCKFWRGETDGRPWLEFFGMIRCHWLPSCYFLMIVFLVEADLRARNFFMTKIAGKMLKRMMGWKMFMDSAKANRLCLYRCSRISLRQFDRHHLFRSSRLNKVKISHHPCDCNAAACRR